MNYFNLLLMRSMEIHLFGLLTQSINQNSSSAYNSECRDQNSELQA
ncbi:hypothetical protein COO91_07643 [Nostoc flagelliforme CCNUN1]|uniref:Uncharacterized protein n=1 Tax=Nostoc flagelliforme CCNUN1 TaxID=2038116 RepID=A0A2K8T1U9_9NOSO|nr:hypothetical protein COO91_07643 [Nostoc flagelliforme CCNUN1]